MNRSFLCSFKNTFQTWLVWGSGMIFSLSSSEAADTPASAPSDSPAALRSLMDESQKLLQAIDTTQPSSDKTSPEKPTPSVQPKSLVKLEKYCEKHPKNWEANYNLGVEKYQLMDYAGAKQSFSKAIQICQNPEQQENTFYNFMIIFHYNNAFILFCKSNTFAERLFSAFCKSCSTKTFA